MSLISLNLAHPEYFESPDKGGLTILDLSEARKMHADFESNAPTGTGLPPLSDIADWEDFLIGMKTNTGQLVTPERAKRCAAVLAIMRGLSEDVSALRLPLYKRTKYEDDLWDEEVPDHPVSQLLNVAPNDLMTPMEVREHMMFDLMTWGGFFNLKNDDPSAPGQIASIWPLQAGYVTRRWREPVWTFTDPTTGISGEFTDGDVWRGSILSGNGIDGTAITLLCREAIGLLLAAEEQGARLFSQGIQSDLVFENSGEAMDDESKNKLRGAIMSRHAGSHRAWQPILLEGGMSAKRIGLTAVESQYIESRKFQIEDIARAFRYPEVLLGSTSGKSSTYASAEQFFQSYTKHTLLPWAVRIEQTGHRDLLDDKEKKKYFLRHDFDQLLRPDQAARFDNWNKAVSGGWMQPAEARRKEGMAFKADLDYFNRAKNMDSLGGASEPAPTDQSGRNDQPRRVARYIVKREERALVAKKESPDAFYSHFSGFIADITGANEDSVRAYVALRKSTPAEQRFTSVNIDVAVNALLSMRG
jgi:HK97 family phage portal protein